MTPADDAAPGGAKGERLDRALVSRGLFASRAQAQAAIEAGLVIVNGRAARRAAETVAPDARIEARAAHPWASRGGVKLAFALDHFALSAEGRIALDVGASTGGFTDVLLARGARRVHAIDVGRDQMAPRLRGDLRVDLREGFDARRLNEITLDPRPDFAVADVSFISLLLVLPAIFAALGPVAEMVLLVKPQFEAGRDAVGRGGLVKDASAREAAVDRVAAAVRDAGWQVLGFVESPVAGGDGNVEFLLAARRGAA